jgi:two-component system chemotaxis sensor kinase CheA
VGVYVLPESLLARFRTVSYERLDRIDSAWVALMQGTGPRSVEDDVFRDLHTLKGDAQVAGFSDVGVLCQRLEDLLSAARGRQYRVNEEVDIVVTMSIQFIGMLLRKKSDVPRTGIDLEGFLAQIQEVLTDAFQRTDAPVIHQPATHLRLADTPGRNAIRASLRLGSVATTVYLEHLRTTGRSRARLRDAWHILVRELEGLEWVPLAPLLERHATSASQLATELGKDVRVTSEAVGIRVSVDVLDTLNTTVLHALRNAVDHGIEPSAARRARGKECAGNVRVTADAAGDFVEVVISDDGQGVDTEAVRRRAAALGLLATEDSPSEAQLLELVFHAGLSTRDAVSDTSGRGVGMDAVKTAVIRVGGSVTLESFRGRGTKLSIRLPQTRSTIDVHAFRAPRSNVLFAIDSGWTLEQVDRPLEAALDAAALLELPVTEGTLDGVDACRAVRLRHINAELTLLAGAAHPGGPAQRICVTVQEDPVEIVTLGGEDALLLRPAALLALTHGDAAVRPAPGLDSARRQEA